MFKGLMEERGHDCRDGSGADTSARDSAAPEERGQGWRARWRWGRRQGQGRTAGSAASPQTGPSDTYGCGCHEEAARHHRHHHGAAAKPGAGRPGQGPHFEGQSLNDVGPGKGCRIFALHGRGAIRQRLMDMGLVPNAILTVVRSAPLNDPIEVQVGATLVSVRRAEAARIEVVHA